MAALQSEKIAILGAGSWGATLAHILGVAGKNVTLYTRDQGKALEIRNNGMLSKPFAVSIPPAVVVTSSLTEAMDRARIIVFCSTSQSLRSLCESVKFQLGEHNKSKNTPIVVSAVKGLELSSLKRMSEIIAEVLPQCKVASLSGPNLAREILAGLPAASVIASHDPTIACDVQRALSLPQFRLYTNNDVIGVELGGSLKNIIAIAAGASDGLKLGANAKAALLTRGLAEMTRLAVALGAKPLTLSGLSGIGDLLATCEGSASRNYMLGYEFAKGRKIADILVGIGAAVEGVPTAEAVCQLSAKHNIDTPIARQVHSALTANVSPQEAIMSLMSRKPSSEL